MKKLFAVMMTLCMMLTAVAAFAEEAAVTTVNWADLEADAAAYEGQFATIGSTGMKMYIPAEFKDTELTQEAVDSGTFMVLKSDKEEKSIVSAQLLPTEYTMTKTALQQQGMTVRDMSVNGITCFQFSVNAEGVITVCFAFATQSDTTMMFSFTNASQEPYTAMYKVMAGSLQVAE